MVLLGLLPVSAGSARAAIEFHVAGPEARHRVSVRNLEPSRLAALRARPAELGRVLRVFVGSPGSGPPSVLGEVVGEDSGIHFLPRFPFVAGVHYTAVFDPGDGPPVTRAFEVAALEGAPPRVVAVFPSGHTWPENTLRVYVHFSQPMEARDAQRHVHLLERDGAPVPLAFVEVEHGLWDAFQTRLTLFLHPGRVKRGIAPGERLGPPMVQGRRYRFVVDTGMRNVAGRPLAAPFEQQVEAAPADRVSPAAAALQLRPPRTNDEAVVLGLPEPLDEALLQRLIWVEDAAGRPLPGQIRVGHGETEWRFQPERAWAAGAHAVVVHPALEDRAGNRFDRLLDRESGEPTDPAGLIRLPFLAP